MPGEPDPLILRRGLSAFVVRVGMRLVHRLLELRWYLARPTTRGVRGIVVTPEGRLVLVRHSYAPGWYFPGGGMHGGEDAEAAVLRELREEIGMRAHGAAELVSRYRHRPNHRNDTVEVFLIREVVFTPRLSLEIEGIGAFDPDALPPETAPSVRKQIGELRARGLLRHG